MYGSAPLRAYLPFPEAVSRDHLRRSVRLGAPARILPTGEAQVQKSNHIRRFQASRGMVMAVWTGQYHAKAATARVR